MKKKAHRTQFSMHKRERGLTLMIINVLHVLRSGPTSIEKNQNKRGERERDEYKPFWKLKISFSSSCSHTKCNPLFQLRIYGFTI